MIRRPPRSTRVRSSAASDVYKRQGIYKPTVSPATTPSAFRAFATRPTIPPSSAKVRVRRSPPSETPVSYTHLRAHETVLDLVCRLLLEKKKKNNNHILFY